MNVRPPNPQKSLIAFEGKPISLPVGLGSASLRDKLLRYSALSGRDVFLRSKSGVRAGNYVGVADVANIHIQILPKISDGSSIEDDAAFLIRMMQRSGAVPNISVNKARPGLEKNTFLDPILERVARSLVLRLNHDPPRRYHREDTSSPVLKGRIDFRRLAACPPGRDWLVPIEHYPLQVNNPLSQLIKAVAIELQRLSTNSRTRLKFQTALDLLNHVEARQIGAVLHDIQLGPYEQHWSDIQFLAKALIRGEAPSPLSSGSTDLFGLLFSLFDLFEALLRKTLRSCGSPDWRIKSKASSRLLTRNEANGKQLHAVTLKPDYVFVDRTGATRCIADAKWKTVGSGNNVSGLNERDVYQLATYMVHYNAKSGILFFPMFGPTDKGANVDCREWRVNGLSGGKLILAHVNVPGLVSDDQAERDSVQDDIHSLVSKYCD